jgi:sugar phosphate isomerase/epimerase
MLSRRFVLGAGAAAVGISACATSPVMNIGSRQLKTLGLQTYTLREIFEPDPVGTLAMLKDLGYDYVELNERNFADRTTEDLHKMITDAGLYSPGSHYDVNNVKDDFAGAVRAAKALDLDYLVMPWIGDEYRSVEGYTMLAKTFNERGRQAREEGFRLAYHNHQFEFDDLGGGQTGYDILLSQTDPDIFEFQLDLFWAYLAQQDIPALMRANPGRFKMCHIKDMKGDPALYRNSRDYDAIGKEIMVNVGEGDIPFEDYFALNDVSGMEYFVIEHDSPPAPYRASMKQSIDDVRAMRF